MSTQQNDVIEENKKELEEECPECGYTGEHKCCDCECDISEKECKEFKGICRRCMWLLSK